MARQGDDLVGFHWTKVHGAGGHHHQAIGEVYVVAPRDPHSYAGLRVTTDAPLMLTETAERMYHLSGTPADCVRVALTALLRNVNSVMMPAASSGRNKINQARASGFIQFF